MSPKREAEWTGGSPVDGYAEVVGVDILPDRFPDFPDVMVLSQVGFLILEGTEPSLDHDVISPPALSVHALPDPVVSQELPVLVTGELTALIAVQDLRLCHLQSFFHRSDDHPGIQRVVNIPTDDAAAIPVDDCGQIDKPMLYGDICDVDRPRLIRSGDNCIPEQIWAYLRLLHSFGKVQLWVNGVDSHFIHVSAGLAPADMMALGFQLSRHLPGSPGRVIRMKMINDLLADQFLFRNNRTFIIDARPVDTQKSRTRRHR